MPKLTDSQLMILSTAGQRDDDVVLPLPKSLKLQRGAVSHVLKNLLKKGLLGEQPTGDNAAAWREGKDGQRLTLVITDAGRQAIGLATDGQGLPTPENVAPRDSKRSAGRTRKASKSKGKVAPGSKEKRTPSAATLRAGTKLAFLLDLLQRKGGATIAEVMKATGWQAHSVRGRYQRRAQGEARLGRRIRKDGGSRPRLSDRCKALKQVERMSGRSPWPTRTVA